jgi:cytochrome c
MHLRVRKIAFLFLLTSAFISSPSWADMALANSKNCMSCHHSDRKVVGPAMKEIAKRYANEPLALATLTTKIQKGGAGVWGVVPMPANPQVSEAEAQKLAAWVLSLR